MASILSSAGNGTGSGVSHTAPASVFVRGTLDGATVVLQVSDDNTTFVKADNVSTPNPAALKARGVVYINCTGTYYIRAVVAGGGASTSVTVAST